jgi:Flp pilus assembly protein TadG
MAKAKISERRKRKSGGNTIMESAFTLMPIFAIIIGFVNYGLSIYRWSTLQNAVREGCRYAITYQTQSGLGQDQSIMNTVQANSLGLVDASLTGAAQQIFVRYYTPGTPIDPPGTPAGSSGAVAKPGGNVQFNLVVVSVEGFANTADWVAAAVAGSFNHPSANPNLKLNVLSADVMGSLPFGVPSVTR